MNTIETIFNWLWSCTASCRPCADRDVHPEPTQESIKHRVPEVTIDIDREPVRYLLTPGMLRRGVACSKPHQN